MFGDKITSITPDMMSFTVWQSFTVLPKIISIFQINLADNGTTELKQYVKFIPGWISTLFFKRGRKWESHLKIWLTWPFIFLNLRPVTRNNGVSQVDGWDSSIFFFFKHFLSFPKKRMLLKKLLFKRTQLFLCVLYGLSPPRLIFSVLVLFLAFLSSWVLSFLPGIVHFSSA